MVKIHVPMVGSDGATVTVEEAGPCVVLGMQAVYEKDSRSVNLDAADAEALGYALIAYASSICKRQR
jgi:hypothetical protein